LRILAVDLIETLLEKSKDVKKMLQGSNVPPELSAIRQQLEFTEQSETEATHAPTRVGSARAGSAAQQQSRQHEPTQEGDHQHEASGGSTREGTCSEELEKAMSEI